jgi:hypothetical protein
MTDDQINIAIAEACGRVRRPDGYWFPPGSNVGSAGIANYCNDLNAMHEAERTLNLSLAGGYARILTSIAWQSEQPVFAPMTATARQRTEAFLKTLGKWEESE